MLEWKIKEAYFFDKASSGSFLKFFGVFENQAHILLWSANVSIYSMFLMLGNLEKYFLVLIISGCGFLATNARMEN